MSIRTRIEEPKTEEQIRHEQEMEALGRERQATRDMQNPFLIRERLIREQEERERYEASHPPAPKDMQQEVAISDALRVRPEHRTVEQIKLLESIGINNQ